MKIESNTEIEVDKEQYQYLIKNFAGVVAHRESEGKFYIMIWLKEYTKPIESFLNSKKSVTN